MNVVYANLKIALFTEEKRFVQRIERCLSGHTVLRIDTANPSAAINLLIEDSPDFLFVDADNNPELALRLVITAASQSRIHTLFFMEKLDQRLVLAAKERGADAVLLKENSDARIRERMEDLLAGSGPKEAFLTETPIEKASGVLEILFTHTPRQTFHLILNYLFNR